MKNNSFSIHSVLSPKYKRSPDRYCVPTTSVTPVHTVTHTWYSSLAHFLHRLCWQGRMTTGLVNSSRQMGQISCFSRVARAASRSAPPAPPCRQLSSTGKAMVMPPNFTSSCWQEEQETVSLIHVGKICLNDTYYITVLRTVWEQRGPAATDEIFQWCGIYLPLLKKFKLIYINKYK